MFSDEDDGDSTFESNSFASSGSRFEDESFPPRENGAEHVLRFLPNPSIRGSK